jgi:hypothetical protein
VKLYLAGPMRGIPEFNHPEFFKVAALLRAAGYEVYSPAERNYNAGHDFAGRDGNEDLGSIGFSLRDALGSDLAWITAEAGGLALLPGWETSAGARAEVAVAHALGLPVWGATALIEHGLRAERILA